MTKATMNWNRMRMEIDGHAGGGTKGNDIICAGESMLICALIGALEEAQTRGRCEMDYEDRDGYAMVWADPSIGCSNEIRAYFRMAVKGMRMLQEQYPEHVSIKEEH